VPLALDEANSNTTYGHFARVLVDVDLTCLLHEQILVECSGYAFFVDIGYERLLAFCSSYKIIFHSINKCRKKFGVVASNSREGKEQQKHSLPKEGKKTSVKYVPKDKGVVDGKAYAKARGSPKPFR